MQILKVTPYELLINCKGKSSNSTGGNLEEISLAKWSERM